jgi:flagellar biosynthetic protein FliQ
MEETFLSQAAQAIQTALYLSAPILIVSLALGILVGILQAVTSVQEQTLSFVPKLLAAGVVLVILGPWMLRVMNTYAVGIFGDLGQFVK